MSRITGALTNSIIGSLDGRDELVLALCTLAARDYRTLNHDSYHWRTARSFLAALGLLERLEVEGHDVAHL